VGSKQTHAALAFWGRAFGPTEGASLRNQHIGRRRRRTATSVRDDLGAILGTTPEAPAVYRKCIDEIVEAATMRTSSTHLVPEPAQGHSPLLTLSGTGIGYVMPTDYGVWSETGRGRAALIAQFSNEARADGPNAKITARATLMFRRGGNEVRRVTGAWLDEPTELAEFPVDQSHSIIVGFVDSNSLQIVNKKRVKVDLNSDEVRTDLVVLEGTSEGEVLIRLTDADTGDHLGEYGLSFTVSPPNLAIRSER